MLNLPTNISEWSVDYGLFGNITAPNITSLEEKEVKDGVNQLEVKGYDKQTVNIEYNVSGQWDTTPYIEYMELYNY